MIFVTRDERVNENDEKTPVRDDKQNSFSFRNLDTPR